MRLPGFNALAAYGSRTRQKSPPGAHPRQRQPAKPRPSRPNRVYKGCTRDAHRMHMLWTLVHPVCIPCTPLVHGLRCRRTALVWSGLSGWRARYCRRLNRLFWGSRLLCGQWPGWDDRVGGVVFGCPAILSLSGNVTDFLAGSDFAKTGGVGSRAGAARG